jgi:hypothetical protein
VSGQLDRVRDHFAAYERCLHRRRAHRDPVADCDRIELERRSAGFAYTRLYVLGEIAQMYRARHRIGPGVGDPNERLAQIAIGETRGFEHGARCGTVRALSEIPASHAVSFSIRGISFRARRRQPAAPPLPAARA